MSLGDGHKPEAPPRKTGTVPPVTTAQPDPPQDALPAPKIRRRLGAFIYEGLLLFGVVMIGAFGYASLTEHRHAMVGRTGLQVFLFLLVGLYFTWFWTHGGQTVAMKTWHIKVVDYRGQPAGWARCVLRYVTSWIWFLPALVTAYAIRPVPTWVNVSLLTVGVVAYAMLARFHPQRQYVHDVLSGTRLLDVQPPRVVKSKSAKAKPN
jgi:uncharacterized RDD family membrane protein YckC